MRAFRDSDFRRFLLWAALAVLAAGGPACGQRKAAGSAGAPASAGDPERVVLQVAGSSYRAADFSRYATAAVGGNWQKLGPAALSQFFDQFVDDRLLYQAALNEHRSLTPEEKLDWIRKLKDEGWTAEEEDAALTSDSGPLAERLQVEKYTAGLIKDLSVSDDEVKAYYESHKERFFLPERFKVSQILQPTEAAAVEAWEKLRGGSEDDFRAVAKAESVGPEAPQGGEMGVFQKGQLPPEMESAILSLQPGEISPIVKSSYGWHIFRLDEKYAAEQTPLEGAAGTIRTELLDQKVKERVARRLLDLRGSLDWTAYPESLPFAYQKVER